MDVSDAINVVVAEDENVNNEDDREAVWYIFPSDEQSVCNLREYLQEKFKDDQRASEGDIILGGWVVLNDEILKDLKQKTGIRPWIIRQRLGDAVFVPSRCPHMVSLAAFIFLYLLTPPSCRSETMHGPLKLPLTS